MRASKILGAALVLLGCCSAANAPAKRPQAVAPQEALVCDKGKKDKKVNKDKKDKNKGFACKNGQLYSESSGKCFGELLCEYLLS
eukprot:17617-Heterococcus_DN1.PRE.3